MILLISSEINWVFSHCRLRLISSCVTDTTYGN